MPLDPTLPLYIQPPQITAQSTTPFQQLGQVLSLQNMMTQGQLGKVGLQEALLKLEQTRQEIDQRRQLYDYLRTLSPQPAVQQPPIAATEQPAPAPATTVPPAAVATPLPGLTTGGFLPAPQLSPDLSGTVSPAGTGFLPPPQLAPELARNLFAPAAAPAPTAPAVAPAAAPAAPTAEPVVTRVPDFLGGLDFRKIMQIGPYAAQYAEPIYKTLEQGYKTQQEGAKALQSKNQLIAQNFQGITDEKTKNDAVATAYANNWISAPERDDLMQQPYDSPRFQGYIRRAETAQEYGTHMIALADQHIKQLEENRAEALGVPQLAEAQSKAQKEDLSAAAQSIQAITDPSQFPGWLKGQSQFIQGLYGPLQDQLNKGLSLDQVKNTVATAGIAPKPGETIPLPASVQQQKIEEAQGVELAKYAAKMQAYQPTIQRVLRGDVKFQDLPGATQTEILPGLIGAGYQGFGKLISDPERERLANMDRALVVLQKTKDTLNDPDKRKLLDIRGGIVTQLPWATEHKNLQSDLKANQIQLRKFVTDGALRGVNQQMVDELFPTIWSQPEHADHQIQNWINTITLEKQQYLNSLSGKVVPPALATPAPESPLGKPSPVVRQNPTSPTQPPPGKVRVRRPNGDIGFIDKPSLPAALKKGYQEIPTTP